MLLVARFFLVLLVVLVAGCSFSGAPPEAVDLTVWCECSSPDGRLIASFYTQSGGGAAGWVYDYVSVRSADAPLDIDAPVMAMVRGQNTRLTWVDRRTLQVEHPSGATVLSSRPEIVTPFGSVGISYVPHPRDDSRLAGQSGCGPVISSAAKAEDAAHGGPN